MKTLPLCPESSTRRGFVKMGTAGTTLAMAASATEVLAAENSGPDVWMLHGSDPRKLMQKALDIIQENGGFGPDAKTLALKVNAAWGRTPEEGANTHPDLVDVFIEGVKKGGIKTVVVPENPCSNAKISFDRSGIERVVKSHKCKMIDLKRKDKSFREVQIPKGKNLKSAEVAGEFLDADVVVNMPVAKHHKGSTLSMAMKNWMGIVKDRRFWHQNDLPQCIADFSSFFQATWTIIDATRCMMDSGPQGPAKELKHPDLLIISRDQVAADSVASAIFHDSPYDITYLKYAEEMGIGVVDQSRMNIHKIEVS
ncbi:DUF362 domain-containing protein [Pontiellaceae bacterium B12219]|nr:DUF362 domain-containing protein [Pontiellaceae bacterium B12219]